MSQLVSITRKYKLSAPMIKALRTGDGGIGTVVALIDRGLMTPKMVQTGMKHRVTDLGRDVLTQLFTAAGAR